jgi:RHS repeat-associated protein
MATSTSTMSPSSSGSLPSRPTASGPDDPRDPDRNGRIDILDARVCVLRCTLPRCARVSPTPPTVSLTAPVADARYLAPATITLAADASGAAPVTRVEFLADATVIATVGNSPYTADWANVAAGTYQLSARATDRIGAATTSGARRIIVDSHNTPPTVSLTAPLDGAAYPLSATVTLMATASDVEVNTPISRVDFYHGQTLIGGSTTAPYRLDWTPPAAGVYRLTARATDSAGAMTTSAAHDLTVQGNLPPTVSLTSPGANERFTAPATVTLTADANDADGVARVDFFHGATLIGSAASSPYRVVWNPVAAGSYLLTAQATDRLGASQSSAAVPITVNAPASAGLTILYLHADHLGTPRVATDDSQTVVWRNPPTSEPFGMALPEEDPDGDGRLTTINLRFPGQYFDQETQAHYNYFRDHYFPELGRYGQSDPIGLAGGGNGYAYVKSSPLNFIDPLGLYTEIIQWGSGPRFASRWGHISGNINGENWSFGPKGWDSQRPSADAYARRQTEPDIDRGGRGIVLDLSPFEEALLRKCLKETGDYQEIRNNCGNPWIRCLSRLGIINPADKARVLPMDVYRIIHDSPRAIGNKKYPGKNLPSGQ